MQTAKANSRKFYFHFNRVNMQRNNPNVWTVHWGGRCIQVRQVKCNAPVDSKFNPTGRQPRAFFEGKSSNVHVTRGNHVAVIEA